MTKDEWERLKLATLKQWLSKKHPAVLETWKENFAALLDLDVWLEEYRDWIYQKFLEEEGE